MTDPRVEEIRARLDHPHVGDIAHLLTKLDEAERGRKVYEGLYAEAESEHDDLQTRLNAAEERERTLIAGVREALTVLKRHGTRGGHVLASTEARAILSRLLPSTPTEPTRTLLTAPHDGHPSTETCPKCPHSTPTEEEEAQEEEGPFMDHTDRMAEWMIEDAERDTSE